jgi:hypothetical protein
MPFQLSSMRCRVTPNKPCCGCSTICLSILANNLVKGRRLGNDLNDQSLRTSKLDKVVYPLGVTTRIGTCENDPGFCRNRNRAVTQIEKYHYAFVICGSFVA